jgi:SAM-dependent methyltransferase
VTSDQDHAHDQDQRHYWEARAATHQSEARGVLFQGVPTELNALIHAWHAEIVRTVFASRLPSAAQVLDLAAGYGRLSGVIQRQRPDVWMSGADVSFTYCKLYRAQIGPALCADLAALPYQHASWDGVLLVTGLMYLEHGHCDAAITQVLTTLKPGGLLLCIDPGHELIHLLRQFGFGRQASASAGFKRSHYLALFDRAECQVIAKGGNGWFTLLLPLLWVLAQTAQAFPILRLLLRSIPVLDGHSDQLLRFALHRWVLVQKQCP